MSTAATLEAKYRRMIADRAKYPNDPFGYAERVRELEAEGLTTSDAQGVADVEHGISGDDDEIATDETRAYGPRHRGGAA